MSSFSNGSQEKQQAVSENPFTQFYGQLLHQGNMLADYVRTGTYQKAMISNASDFAGKVVLDVGTGSGILSFFALQAGAAKVYAVDASDAVIVARKIAKANGYEDRMEVIKGKIEDIELPEKVDIIISEPIGFLLVHERMLESYVAARDKFLKPGGLMFPTTGSIVLSPFSEDALYREQCAKATFWENTNFYGIDFSCIGEQAYTEYLQQAIVGFVDPSILISHQRTVQNIDFNYVDGAELQNFTISFEFLIEKTAIMHGMAGWFDINFIGSTENVLLSTAPECPGTHWYQCKLLLAQPLAVNRGQTISGQLVFTANESFSYYIEMTVHLDGTEIVSKNTINLKDQHYSYLQGSSTA